MVGNTPNYNKFDIIRCFLNIDKNISRNELVKRLELGEGTIRTILNILKNKKLIASTRKGHFLTKKGFSLSKKIKLNIEIKRIKIRLFPKYKKTAILLKNNKKIKVGYKQRDVALKNGAESALLFLYNASLYFPDINYRTNTKELDNLFHFKKGNILIITFADSYRKAENSALAAAVELDKELKI